MSRVHAVAASAAVGVAAVLGTFPFLLMLLSLAINYAYSVGPLRLSYRTYLAPLVLTVAYVHMLRGADAPLEHQLLVAATLLALVGTSYLLLWRNLQRALIGYRR